MNKIKLACLSSLLVCSAANAAPCDNFQIKLKNNLADNLLVTNVKLSGAKIQPGSFDKLNSGTELAFTVNNSTDNALLQGEITLKTISIPVKNVKIKYSLFNNAGVCGYTDIPQQSDYSVLSTPGNSAVVYDIFNQ